MAGVINFANLSKKNMPTQNSTTRVLRKRDGNFDGDDDTASDNGMPAKKIIKNNKNKKGKKKGTKPGNVVGETIEAGTEKENVAAGTGRSSRVYQHIPVQIVKIGQIKQGASNGTSTAMSMAAGHGHSLNLRLSEEMERDVSTGNNVDNNDNGPVADGMTTLATGSTLTKTLQESFIGWRAEQGGTVAFDNDKRAVQRFVRESLFSNLKFLRSEEELEYTGKLHYNSGGTPTKETNFLFCHKT